MTDEPNMLFEDTDLQDQANEKNAGLWLQFLLTAVGISVPFLLNNSDTTIATTLVSGAVGNVVARAISKCVIES